jgi:hypothetical protein
VDEGLRDELHAMLVADQRLREQLTWRWEDGELREPEELSARIDEIDRRNAERLREILDERGWPGRSLVGEDGAHWAWVLAMHAYHDPPFMRRCLDLMTSAVELGEASALDRARLCDRVLIEERGEQLYGTHFLINARNEIAGARLVDPEHVDDRRRAVGLPPLAEHLERLERIREENLALEGAPRPPPSEPEV